MRLAADSSGVLNQRASLGQTEAQVSSEAGRRVLVEELVDSVVILPGPARGGAQ